MKNITLLFILVYSLVWPNDSKQPSTINQVTVYLSGAQITRTAQCKLNQGSNTVVFTGLSPKIDESSIQVSGLYGVSILAIDYDINHLGKSESNPQVKTCQEQISKLDYEITLLKNHIFGLEEEQKVITTNRMVSTNNQALELNKVKEISKYYRERLTAIKNEIFEQNLKINKLEKERNSLQLQVSEVNNTPKQPQGEITIKFDAPRATELNLRLKYMVEAAGWVPNYDITSNSLNTPLLLAYKANVYQDTGVDWNNVVVTLSTGNPNYNISKPKLETHYLNYTTSYSRKYSSTTKKKGYAYNPSVKKVAGTVTDSSGMPLPGVSVIIKGTKKGTTTDFDGQYELEIPFGQELSFSYIGMHKEDIPLYASIINVNMEEDAEALDEVVVTAMGVKREPHALGYAVTSVDVENVLNGRAAGVQIRGVSSFRGRTTNKMRVQEPLYIIDGTPVTNFVEGDLDANEIATVEILKGADATELYGSKAISGVVLITTKKSNVTEGATKTEFVIKKSYTIPADNDITAIEISNFKLPASYNYFAAPLINENVFLTASFMDWEKHQLLPGEANIYFEGTYAGKTVLDPYSTKSTMVISLGIDPNITVTRTQQKNMKSKSFVGNQRILDRSYLLEVKNNKSAAINLKLMDRIPLSENKEIKVDDIVTNEASFDNDKGLLTWKLQLKPQERITKQFAFKIKYPKGRYISL